MTPYTELQAYASLLRIMRGEYTPDAAACGMTFEDGSALQKDDAAVGGWRIVRPLHPGVTMP